MPLLSKSRFKIAQNCPTKLYYYNHPELYANKAIDDPFLQALADGGFQVGALAKLYYPSPHEITTGDKMEGLRQTDELLKKQEVTIHEACFGYGNKFFIKADIVVKHGNKLDLIEVKAKSYGTKDKMFNAKETALRSEWKEYLYDLAFQYWVVTKAYPHLEITPHLLMVNKDRAATVDGLHQKFKVARDIYFDVEGKPRKGVRVLTDAASKREDLGDEILFCYNASREVNFIIAQENFERSGKSFDAYVQYLGELCVNDTKWYNPISKACKGCEYVTLPGQPILASGMNECWLNALKHLREKDLERQKFFEVWKLGNNPKAVEAISASGKWFIDELTPEHIDPEQKPTKFDEALQMSMKGRQWQQVRLVLEKSDSPFVLLDPLRDKIASFKFPYHFIDFETIAPAIPFHKGMRPYQTIAYQFSHHIMNADGKVTHANEWLCTDAGAFPNFEFVRRLKAVLEQDEGTVFRYAAHENTVLNHIREQLRASTENDRQELVAFIESITHKKKKNANSKSEAERYERRGARDMVDLLEMVQHFYLHPLMKGSNSIKKVLPAMLSTSDYLRSKYSQPLYGTPQMQSKNFACQVWWQLEDGQVQDPYKLLPAFYDEATDTQLDDAVEELPEELKKYIGDGGAAMMAYAEMQYTDMSEQDKNNRIESLLKYCELDTFAMVMLMEEFVNL